MESRPFLLHALSPLLAGTGQSVDVIDLPIARMRASGIPIVPGSSIKGVLRDAREISGYNKNEHRAVFGPSNRPSDHENASDHAGALIVCDARLLALPVRSFSGTFAWITSPLLLELAWRDLSALPEVPEDRFVLNTTGIVLPNAKQGETDPPSILPYGDHVYLEDLDLPIQTGSGIRPWARAWAQWLAPKVFPRAPEMFRRRFGIVDDETMTFLWKTATQVDVRNRLDAETRTVARGALWSEESLPPETVLLGVLQADRSRKGGQAMTPTAVLDAALPAEASLQFGGKATVGRGLCRMVPLMPPAPAPSNAAVAS